MGRIFFPPTATADLGGHSQEGDIHHSDVWMLRGEEEMMRARVYSINPPN